MFYLCCCKASRTVSSCIKCSRSLFYLLLSVLSLKISLTDPSYAPCARHQGDTVRAFQQQVSGISVGILRLSNVLLAGQHSLGPLEEYLKLSQPLNSLEYIPTVEISLAVNEVI